MMKKLLYFFIAAIMVCACQPKRPRLVIVHVNDTHSHFEPLRVSDDIGKGGVIERAAFVDSIRLEYGEDKVLLLHAGDFSQGTSYFTELEGQLEPRIINDFRYDCTCLGNHELDNDIEDLEQRLALLTDTKVVCANLDLSQFELQQYVKPYAVIERGGMKIGIIGLITDISSVVSKTVSSRIVQLDNLEVTNKWADYLRDTEKCDLIILLSHIGYTADQELVPHTRNVDIVIGGHSHTFVEDILYVKNADSKDVPIITDGCWGLEMGQLNIW